MTDTQAQKLLAEVRAAQERLTEATEALRQAEAHRRAALRSAMAAGIPRAQIADAIGASRVRLYQIMGQVD